MIDGASRSTCCRLPWHAHRDRLVLKPNDDYGGAGIVLGWEVDDADVGGRACDRALRRPYIVQERVAICPRSRSRAWWTAGSSSVDRIVDTAPFVLPRRRLRGRLPDAASPPRRW